MNIGRGGWGFSLLASAFLWCLIGAALAQAPVITQPYVGIVTQNSSGTITTGTAGVFQSVFVAPDQTKNQRRAACTIQNNSATNSMSVFFGPIASATVATSVVIGPGQPVYCNIGGVTVQEQVSVSGTSGDAFYAAQQ